MRESERELALASVQLAVYKAKLIRVGCEADQTFLLKMAEGTSDLDIEDLILECDPDSEDSFDDSDSYDNDHGEIGEYDEDESDVEGSSGSAGAVERQPVPYQNEPLPRNPAVAGRVVERERDGDEGAGEIDLRSRLDPANVQNWQVLAPFVADFISN